MKDFKVFNPFNVIYRQLGGFLGFEKPQNLLQAKTVSIAQKIPRPNMGRPCRSFRKAKRFERSPYSSSEMAQHLLYITEKAHSQMTDLHETRASTPADQCNSEAVYLTNSI